MCILQYVRGILSYWESLKVQPGGANADAHMSRAGKIDLKFG